VSGEALVEILPRFALQNDNTIGFIANLSNKCEAISASRPVYTQGKKHKLKKAVTRHAMALLGRLNFSTSPFFPHTLPTIRAAV